MGGRRRYGRNYHQLFLHEKDKILERLKKNSISRGDCVRWCGVCTNSGHGNISIDGKIYKVHRISYYIHNDNFNIDDETILVLHRRECPYPNCWNPNHLYLGSKQDNMDDLSSKIQDTPNYSCGHPRTPENTYIFSDGYKRCRLCDLLRHMKKNLERTK